MMRELLGEMTDIVERRDRRAWLDSDAQFHDLLYGATKRARLLAVIRNLREEAGRYRLVGLTQPHELEDGLRGHQDIVDACAKRDGAAVELFIERSLARSRDMLRGLLVREQSDGAGTLPASNGEWDTSK
jgi:DNA-binding GntR family transcriptional regulator